MSLRLHGVTDSDYTPLIVMEQTLKKEIDGDFLNYPGLLRAYLIYFK